MQQQEKKLHRLTWLSRYDKYLGPFVSGAVGAGLSTQIILILGFANLLADGLSMSIGAYLSSKSERSNYHKHKAVEYWEVDNLPEKERDEIREIYRSKGFEGETLEKIVEVSTADRDRGGNVLMREELLMNLDERAPC